MSSNVREDELTLPKGLTHHARVNAIMSDFTLWYNMDSNENPCVPETLVNYIDTEVFLSTKQVPSALLLRYSGSVSVTQQRELLLRQGFTLTEQTRSEPSVRRDMTIKNIVGDNPSYSSSLSDILKSVSEANDLVNHNMDYEEIEIPSSPSSVEEKEIISEIPEELYFVENGIKYLRNARYKIKYDDPWKIHAATPLSVKLGYKQEITVWSGDGIRLQDPLPPHLLGDKWEGSKKNRIRFSMIRNAEVRIHILMKHTHWGKMLRSMCNDPKYEGFHTWARTLRRRITAFIKGKLDPCLSKTQKEKYFSDPEELRDEKTRANRFIELLKTVDGIFLQRYLSYPEEVWTWERFDMFILGNISYLIGDEFFDGVLAEPAKHLITAYSQLKKARKWFKYHAHKGDLKQALENELEVSPWCRQFVNVWKRALIAKDSRYTMIMGILSQTRGCGTPPPLVVLQSKIKFLTTVQKVHSPISNTKVMLRRMALNEVISQIPDHAMTGLSTKSRITVTTSACWENIRKEGGTTEAIREILNPSIEGMQYPIRDLETGTILSYVDRTNCESLGELIFWACLDLVTKTPRVDLRSCFLTVVKEPGKARSVTKARAHLKIVLDVVSKLCAEPLAKGVRSSQSGMTASNHGWNVFQRFFTEEMKNDVFRIANRDEDKFEGYVERTDTYEDLYTSSTDYEEATDQMDHIMAREIAEVWMRKCGIPLFLRSIVQTTCFEDRYVFFHASGMLEKIGRPATQYGDGIRCVTLRQGVLMGDPLTKICLHIVNVVVRHLGERIFEPSFYSGLKNANQVFEIVMSKVKYK